MAVHAARRRRRQAAAGRQTRDDDRPTARHHRHQWPGLRPRRHHGDHASHPSPRLPGPRPLRTRHRHPPRLDAPGRRSAALSRTNEDHRDFPRRPTCGRQQRHLHAATLLIAPHQGRTAPPDHRRGQRPRATCPGVCRQSRHDRGHPDQLERRHRQHVHRQREPQRRAESRPAFEDCAHFQGLPRRGTPLHGRRQARVSSGQARRLRVAAHGPRGHGPAVVDRLHAEIAGVWYQPHPIPLVVPARTGLLRGRQPGPLPATRAAAVGRFQ